MKLVNTHRPGYFHIMYRTTGTRIVNQVPAIWQVHGVSLAFCLHRSYKRTIKLNPVSGGAKGKAHEPHMSHMRKIGRMF